MKKSNVIMDEVRCFQAAELRVKKDADGKAKIEGHAAVFDKLSVDLGGFREKIARGTFADTIKEDDIRALVDHDSSKILGRNTAGTLTLTEDDEGLLVQIIPPDTSVGRDIVTSIERGDISGMSFGFRTPVNGDSWEIIDGQDVRTLKKVKLIDVSPVTFPAYPDTSVAVRSLAQYREKVSHKPFMKMQLDLIEAEMG